MAILEFCNNKMAGPAIVGWLYVVIAEVAVGLPRSIDYYRDIV